MKRIGAVIVGLACLSAAAHAIEPAYSELNDDLFKGVKTEMKDARATKAGYIPANDPNWGTPSQALEWVSIPGGQFELGTPDFDDAKPIAGKTYTIKTFQMSKTLVTVEQYAECVVKGGCTQPDTGKYCNWGEAGREHHPVNCVDWEQANQYAKFKNARLPSEAEYEYAATSGGKNQMYPWGNEDATCDKAVMYGSGGDGCGSGSTMPVCSKPAGNTAQGLCDMVGNVWQWVQDKSQSSYADVPNDGSAYEASGFLRVIRGGSFNVRATRYLRADYREDGRPAGRYYFIGFRLSKSSR